MVETNSASGKLAGYIGHLSKETVPTEVAHAARLCVLDWIGCAVAGASLPGSKILREVVIQGSSGGSASLIGGDAPVDAATAALHNGYASHALEYDDTHPGAFAHITSPVLAAAFAMGEEQGATLADLITGFVAGYETAARVGIPLGSRMFQEYHVHPTGFLGYIGAAAAAGKLLGLTNGQMEMALGLAGIQAGGLLESVATMAEGLCAAHSSSGGLVAARLAAAGFQGPRTVLEGDAGIFAAFGAPRDLDVLADGNFQLLRNEFKMYPSCGFTHPMLDAILELRGELPGGSSVHELSVTVHLWTHAADLVDRSAPETGAEAQFSAQFCAAIALLDGVVGPRQFTDERIKDPEVVAIMRRVKVERDPTMNRHEARVSISGASATLERSVTNEGRLPDERGLVIKFTEATAAHYGLAQVPDVVETILSSDDCKVADLLLPLRRTFV